MSLGSYVVITPARNEAEHIEHTIRSMVAQAHVPSRWVIVNDGSTDATAHIIDAAAKEHQWIRVVHRSDRGFRKPSGGVIEAFYDGYQLVTGEVWKFLVKFDADLSFEPEYFQRCLQRFESDANLGIAGGTICFEAGGRLFPEAPGDPAFHVRGATKIYRRECWEQIGGLIRAPGWDGLDELKANMLGWRTRTFSDVPLKHHRYTGSADGTLKNQVKFGRANYIMGYHPLFMALKCLKRSLRRPYVVGAAGMIWGFCSGYLGRVPRVDDPELIRFIRRQQINHLLRRNSIWGKGFIAPERSAKRSVVS